MRKLEKKTAKFIADLEALKAPPIYTLSPQEARKVLDHLQSGGTEKTAVSIEDGSVPGGPHGDVSVRIFRPAGFKGKLPVILYTHGGGWILGNKHTHDRLVRELCVGAHAAVVFVSYTLSPEAKFPIAIEESYAVLKHIKEHGKNWNFDSEKIAVAGDSVGGNMAIALTLLAKERKGPKILKQLLFYPVTDANFNSSSYQEFAEGPWLTKKAMEWFWNAYAPHSADRKKSLACPLQASLEELKNLPPALVITDENDVLRDEGEAYAHKLMQAGVDVTSIRYLGTLHDFMMLNAVRETPAAESAIQLAIAHLQKVFMPQKASMKGVA
jgi:acetyl esterase